MCASARRSTTQSTARRSSRPSRRATAKPAELGDRARLQGLLRPQPRFAVPVQRRQSQAAPGRCRLAAGPDGVLQKDGQPFQFTMDVGQRGVLQPTNELIQQNLKAVGIQADLNSMEWNAYIQKVVVNRDYTATVNWWVYPNDPDVFPYFHCSTAGQGLQHSGLQGPEARRPAHQSPDRDRPDQTQARRGRSAVVHGRQSAVRVPLVPAGDRRHQRQSPGCSRTSTCATTCTTCRSGGSRSRGSTTLRIALQRVIQGVIVLLFVSAITFLLVNLAPGGPSSLMRMDATPEQRAALSKRLGLDEPIPVRYGQWLAGAVRGDLEPHSVAASRSHSASASGCPTRCCWPGRRWLSRSLSAFRWA